MVSTSRLTPSSAGRGAGHQRTSSTQLRVAKPSTFDRGTTATGSPDAGISTNRGRVGLTQTWVWNPVR